jgi:hypothetical protein
MKASDFCLLFVGFLLGLFFRPEGGSNMFLQNIGRLLVNYRELYSGC